MRIRRLKIRGKLKYCKKGFLYTRNETGCVVLGYVYADVKIIRSRRATGLHILAKPSTPVGNYKKCVSSTSEILEKERSRVGQSMPTAISITIENRPDFLNFNRCITFLCERSVIF